LRQYARRIWRIGERAIIVTWTLESDAWTVTPPLHILRPSMSGSYAIPRIACQTSAVVIEILSVEDDDNLAYVIMTTLRLGGFSATRAKNGKEALRLALDDGKPDLIVLDVMLPDLNGFEVCQRLREAGSAIPVIFLTAADSVGDKVRGLVIGGDDYLAKPFSGEELIARIRAKLRRVAKPQRINRCDAMTSRWMTNPTR